MQGGKVCNNNPVSSQGKIQTTLQFIFLLKKICTHKDSSAPISVGNMFQDLPQLRESPYNTECYI
jgi:hypothetical protein